MQSLALEDDERPLRGKKKQRVPEDLIPAVIFREARRQRRLFLMSDLSSDLVEELGLGYVESPHELMNLVKRSKQAVVVGNAHFASLQLASD